MTRASLDRDVEQRLREHQIRYTPGRRAVVGALEASDGPRSAAELHDLIGDAVPLSSIYRSLTVLEDAGVVIPHHGTKGLTRFELAEWITGHHHHVVCVECGAVEDIAVPPALESAVRRVVDEIGAAVAFAATNHMLEIEGTCGRCT